MSVEKLPLAVPRPPVDDEDLEWAQAELVGDDPSFAPESPFVLGDEDGELPQGFERVEAPVGAPPLYWGEEPAPATAQGHEPTFMTGDPDPHTLPTEPLGRTRVSFSTPLLLQVDGEELAHEGAVTNLSAGGLGCLATADLDIGQAVWASFALPDEGQPISVVCQVVWRRDLDHGHRLYGLSFSELQPRHAERLAVASQGAPLSAAVSAQESAPEVGGPAKASSLGGIAMGVAAGIALAIGVTMAFSNLGLMGSDESPGEVDGSEHAAIAAVAPAPVAPEPAAPPSPSAAAEPASVATSASAPAEAAANPTLANPAGPTGPAALPAITPPAASPTPSPVAGESAPVEVARPVPPAKKLPPKESFAAAEEGDVLRPSGDRERMPLALLTDGPVDQHITFWLSHPRRLVIDIPGRKSGFKRHRYRIEHPLASQLRVGNHPGKVRFVLETEEAVSPEIFTTPKGNSLAIEIRRAD